MFSKSQRACMSETFMATNFIAECRTSMGNPFGPSKRAQSTVPLLLRMLSIVTWIPPHEGDWPATAPGTIHVSRTGTKPVLISLNGVARRDTQHTWVQLHVLLCRGHRKRHRDR